VDGGKPGAASKKTLVRANGEEIEMPAKVRDVPVFEGDRLIFETAGAGGVGDPVERDPEAIAKDVRWSLISPEAAESLYGVVVGDDGSVDAVATESKREEIMANRGESPGFDHGDLPPLDEQRRMIAETRRTFNEWLSGELGKARGNGS
jgi:N-methylhydantoinase B